MTPEDKPALEHHAREIAKLLHRNTPTETITTLEGIEQTVRGEILEHISPEIGIFYRTSYRHLPGQETAHGESVRSLADARSSSPTIGFSPL